MIADNRIHILDVSLSELREIFKSWGEPEYRALHVWEGIFRKYWNKSEDFTSLPKRLRTMLDERFVFSRITPVQEIQSTDEQTVKTLFNLPEKNAIEAVLMKYEHRQTLCISTQAGCAMGCVFCATGQMGFQKNLTAGEILEQVIYYARKLARTGQKVTNIVVMGMGEPFQNYSSTMNSIDRLNDPDGFNLSARKFTISTVGLVPIIMKFADQQRQINLAISLHAANDTLRSSLLPINKKYPIADLLDACNYYINKTNRRITFEWALIKDVNDSPADASELAQKIKGMLCHVNIIPLNPTNGYPGKSTTRERAEVFKQVLEKSNIPCTIRLRRGIEIHAGCGQLASKAL